MGVAIVFFLQELLGKRELKKVKDVNIKLMNSIDYGETVGECREVHNKDGTWSIFFKLLAKETFPELISTLAHECIHAKQTIKAELETNDDYTIWTWKKKPMKFKKEWYTFTRAQQNDNLPWEKEANENEGKLAKKFFNKYFNNKVNKVNENE